MSRTPIHIIIPVWGEAYTRCLVDIGMPALLAPGNLPALSASDGHLCHIVTTRTDRAAIEKAPSFRLLAQAIEVRFDDIEADPQAAGDRHYWQSYCNRRGIAVADERGAAMVFLNPDVIIADGGLRTLASLLERGRRAIQVLGIRLLKETALPALLEGYSAPDRSQLTISPRQLIGLAMDHLHPLTMQHVYDAPEHDLTPTILMWRAGGEGLVARCFHLHPMLVHPRVRNAPFSTTIDDDYLRAACPDPNDEYVVMDSDEFCACELSGMDRMVRSQGRAMDIPAWAAAAARPQHFDNFVRRIILHAERTDQAAWNRACAASDETVNDILQRVLDIKCGGLAP